jgi:alginate O-acetyltransferase complex protein AlgI
MASGNGSSRIPMIYTDTLFLALFAAIAFISTALKPLPPVREWLLIGFSVLVIASWGIFDAILFLSIAVANFFAARAVAWLPGAPRRFLLIATIAADIGALGLFKYSNFIGDNIAAVTGWPTPQLALGIPLAISFYTFHVISYLVDVHRKVVPEASFRHYIFYLSFFPHVVAGPIVRAWQLMPQLRTPRRVRTDLAIGLHFLVTGIFLKSILADNIGGAIDPFWRSGTDLGFAERWLLALLYYCQIYGDFAGYSLMALGMARLLGYRLPANFRCPMLAASLQEFWRRWHITFYRWLRDYVYIGLGGSRGGFLRTGINVFATMVLGGLWHGAGWGFVLWGAMHGAMLVVERALGRERTRAFHGRWGPWWVVTQIFVILAWVPFRAPDLATVGEFYAAMVVPTSFYVRSQILEPLLFAVPVMAHQLSPFLIRHLGRRRLPYVLGAGTGVMLLLAIVVHSPSKVFIYFRF